MTSPDRGALAKRDERSIERRLRAAWKRERLFAHVRGACHLVTWAALVIVVDLIADWLLDLPGAARIGLALVSAALLGWVFVRRWWRALARFDASRVALRVERLHPGLRSLLVSHVELGDPARAPAGASPALLAALHRQAIERASGLDFRGLVDFRRLRKLAFVAGAVAVLFACSVALATDFYRVFLARMLDPSSSLSYPTRTRITSVTGDLVVREGDPVTLEARAAGELPPAGSLRVRYPEAAWEEIELRGDGERFRHAFVSQSRGFEYVFEIGDARSDVHRVRVISAPRVVSATIELAYPDYTGRGKTIVESLDIETLEGTVATWNVLCDRPLDEAALVRDSGEVDLLEVDDGDPRRVRGSLVLTDPFTYTFRWIDARHGFEYEDGVRRTVRLIPDRAPRVEIVSPKGEEKATRRKVVTVVFRASDDHALRDAAIVFSRGGGEEGRHELGKFPETPDGPVTARWKPLESLPDLSEGDVVSWAVEVSDNREGARGPNRGRSRTLELEIVSVDEYLRYIAEKKAQLFSTIQGVLGEETRASRNVKELKDDT